MKQFLENYTAQLSALPSLLTNYVKAEEKSQKERENKQTLSDYLNMQEMDFIKFIQVVIHIGKTKEVGQVDVPGSIYVETMQAFDLLKGWRPKEIEIQNMIIKAPLDEYLEKGLAILSQE